MASNPESHADIVKEMRNFALEREHARYAPAPNWKVGNDTRNFANRLEVAHNREVNELRNGISELLDALQSIYDEEFTSYGTGEVYNKWRKVLEETK